MSQSSDERAAEMRELFFESAQELLQALNDPGWTAPAQAACYWVGDAMHKTDFKDLPKVPDNVQGLAGILASDAAHLANLLKQQPYPGVPKSS